MIAQILLVLAEFGQSRIIPPRHARRTDLTRCRIWYVSVVVTLGKIRFQVLNDTPMTR